MTVGELKEKLANVDNNLPVVVRTEDADPVYECTSYDVLTSASFYDDDYSDNVFVLYF